jgi:hypothetical protein
VTQPDFCIQENQTLQVPVLEENQIGDVGAAALTQGIAVSCVARGCCIFFVVGYRTPW